MARRNRGMIPWRSLTKDATTPAANSTAKNVVYPIARAVSAETLAHLSIRSPFSPFPRVQFRCAWVMGGEALPHPRLARDGHSPYLRRLGRSLPLPCLQAGTAA